MRLARAQAKPIVNKTLARSSGEDAEALAAAYLERQGLQLLARNWRVRGGEIDLVCVDGDSLVFVEVRLRRSAAFGGAAASIDGAKQRRLIHAARHYLLNYGGDRPCRFDAVLLDDLSEGGLRWLKNAFVAV